MKNIYKIYTSLLLTIAPIALHAQGLTEENRQYVREVAQNSLDEIFAGALNSLNDQTTRYTTAMSMLRELNGKAETPGDKALVRAAEKNVEEQYRTLLTKSARDIVKAEIAVNASLRQEDRDAINRLIASADDFKTLLRDPETVAEAKRRRKKLISQLKSFYKENLSDTDKELIKQAKNIVAQAYKQWQASFEPAPVQEVAIAVTEEAPVMEKNPPLAPSLEPKSAAEIVITPENEDAPPMESEPPMAPALDETEKKPRQKEQQQSTPTTRQQRTLPEGREALFEQIKAGRTLRTPEESTAMRERQQLARQARQENKGPFRRAQQQGQGIVMGNALLSQEELAKKFANVNDVDDEPEVTIAAEEWED